MQVRKTVVIFSSVGLRAEGCRLLGVWTNWLVYTDTSGLRFM